jgi:hypothetical protein
MHEAQIFRDLEALQFFRRADQHLPLPVAGRIWDDRGGNASRGGGGRGARL